MPEERAGLPIIAFDGAAAWESWLSAQPRDHAGIWLKLAKAGNAASMLTKPQAIDAALIHGWIDGQLGSYEDAWFLTRFTPRKARSKWSGKNRARAVELIAAGRMAAGGQAEIDAAKADGRWDAAYAPQSSASVPDDLATALAATPGARAFFDGLDATNRYAILYRIHDAKQPQTRAARIARFVTMCARGDTIYPRGKTAD